MIWAGTFYEVDNCTTPVNPEVYYTLNGGIDFFKVKDTDESFEG